MKTKKLTHGGKRKGAGRKAGTGKKIKTSITLTKEHFKKTAGKRSLLIEKGLELILNES